ncbi:hypothetical protein LAZ40_04910 [Cereibacter sphaeroides]|uniref:hypothetical protein n=1 Tax=Cereibacter sphaeroides TaxID=1063 RepID=UPI001F37E854|nr:hypothetical protein [Cereibacter sphaeroides]MCE6958396.1 hypothetical protein [Cereibacter sphaeroides]MCE6972263.1 hypothetical protein [Cereibacter sphaeroides]
MLRNKTFSKAVFATLAGVGMITMLAQQLHAETTVTTSIETIRTDVGGLTLDYAGLKTEVEGGFGGLHYDATLSAGDMEGVGARDLDIRAGYLFGDVAGPAVAYEYAKIGSEAMDRVLVGIEGAYSLSDAAKVGGRLVSDIDEFGDDYTLTLDGDYALGEGLTLTGEYEHVRLGTMDSDEAKIGARYGLTEAAFLDGKVTYTDAEGVDATGVEAGIGFSF